MDAELKLFLLWSVGLSGLGGLVRLLLHYEESPDWHRLTGALLVGPFAGVAFALLSFHEVDPIHRPRLLGAIMIVGFFGETFVHRMAKMVARLMPNGGRDGTA